MQGRLKRVVTQLTTDGFKLAASSPRAPPAPFCNYWDEVIFIRRKEVDGA